MDDGLTNHSGKSDLSKGEDNSSGLSAKTTRGVTNRVRPTLKLASLDQEASSEQRGEPHPSERRVKQRRTVLWPARLLVGRHDVACQIWNLSLGGARIRCDLPLREGSPVALKIPEIEALEAHISWSEGDSMGLQFVGDESFIKRHLKNRLSALGIQ